MEDKNTSDAVDLYDTIETELSLARDELKVTRAELKACRARFKALVDEHEKLLAAREQASLSAMVSHSECVPNDEHEKLVAEHKETVEALQGVTKVCNSLRTELAQVKLKCDDLQTRWDIACETWA